MGSFNGRINIKMNGSMLYTRVVVVTLKGQFHSFAYVQALAQAVVNFTVSC